MKDMKDMKRWMRGRTAAAVLCTAAVPALCGGMPPQAGDTVPLPGVRVESPVIKRNNDLMSVRFRLGMEDLPLPGNRAAVFTPVLVNGTDSAFLPPVGVYSRVRWYQYLRAGEPLGGAQEQSVRYSERPPVLAYNANVPYSSWMNGSGLILLRRDYGCCRTLLGEGEMPVGGYRELAFTPMLRYVRPSASVKTRSLSGRAYIDFPVNRTEMYPDYRQNPRELQKIMGTIDSIRADKDITVSAITIKGYASPEGPYANNVRLAKGRTETLRRYVENMYRFGQGFIRTGYEPEDWEGLRRYVESSGLAHRDEILALINSDLKPDDKNRKIQTAYPEEYRFLLQTVYPGLRHSDYTIEYTIRGYGSIDEIAALLRTAPQKLSLEEMYLLAQTLEPGSGGFNEVMETAVRMYPDDETANLNAANSAMTRNDLERAGKYLSKAGAGAEAEYARGMLQALQGDYKGAGEKVIHARSLGMDGVEEMISHLEEMEASVRAQGGETPENAGEGGKKSWVIPMIKKPINVKTKDLKR